MMRTGALCCAAIAFLASGSLASAQVAPGRPGITVTGRGTVRRAADLVRFTVSVANTSGRGTPADALSAADELVRALKSAGVDDAAIANPLNGIITAQRFVNVTGTLRKPTPDRIRTLFASLATVLPNSNALVVQNINVMLALDDCAAALDAAEKAAVADAHDRALRLAADSHVALGALVALSANDTANAGQCPTKPDRVFTGFNGFDPSASALDVVLVVNASATYDIRSVSP